MKLGMRSFIMVVALQFVLSGFVLPVTAATVAYWQLDEAAGSYVDSVGNNDLTRSSGTTNTVNVASISFPDTSDARESNPASQTDPMAKGPHMPVLDLTDNGGWTLEGYFRTASSVRQFIASNNPNGAANTGAWDFELSYNTSSTGQLTLRVSDAVNATYQVATTSGLTLTDNEFHHWAITWDPSTTTVTVFVDRVSAASVSVPLQPATASNRLFYIGGFLLNTGVFHTSLMVDGEIDEVRLSSGVLKPVDFLSSRRGTFAYWHLDEASGDYIDSVGSSNLARSNGTQNASNVATITNPDASDERGGNPASQTAPRAKGPHIPELDLTNNDGWTLEGYIRNASSLRQFIVSNNPGGVNNSGAWDLEMSYVGIGQLTLRVADPDVPLYLQVSTTGTPLNDNEFHHWAITWDPSATTNVALFVDGAMAAAMSVPLQSATATDRLLYIGGFLLSSAGGFHTSLILDGELDEMRMSIGVLTPSEFLSPPPPPPPKCTVILIE